MIQLHNVARTFEVGGGLTVLNGISLDIRRSEYAGILGASGSGKSTLLYILGLLDRPTAGAMFFEGKNVTTLSDNRLATLRGTSIGFVFQSFHLINQFSVVENVELPLFYQKVPRRRRRARAERALEQVHLSHRLHHVPNELSGGECQRTAIARALITEPDLILADEPTGNLDSKTGSAIFDVFEELQSRGKTLIVVTHDKSVAARIPRIIRIADGVIVEDSTA